ncbi:MAG TPA: hypothetical protein VH144_01455 [Candidatus Saccharimonadales bacterium]|nr:hypothetical protein [Candidatus Saccharimonadales bacterium]
MVDFLGLKDSPAGEQAAKEFPRIEYPRAALEVLLAFDLAMGFVEALLVAVKEVLKPKTLEL